MWQHLLSGIFRLLFRLIFWTVEFSRPPHLPELVEGDGVVFVGVGLLDGSLSDALQLLLRHLQAQHRPQHLRVTASTSQEALLWFKTLWQTVFSWCFSNESPNLTCGEPQGSTVNFYADDTWLYLSVISVGSSRLVAEEKALKVSMRCNFLSRPEIIILNASEETLHTFT